MNHPHQPQHSHHPSNQQDDHLAAASAASAQVHHEPHHDKGSLQRPKQKRRGDAFWSVLQVVGGAIIVALLCSQFIFHSYIVDGQSMEKTLQHGDRLIINKLGKSLSTVFRTEHIPKRGDIIVFKSTIRDDEQLIKRVIGLPGERVIVDDGIITVYNMEHPEGFNPDEAYEDKLPDLRTGEIDMKLGPKELFVAGDNRIEKGSLDSRNHLGPVPLGNVIGDLVLRFYPTKTADFF